MEKITLEQDFIPNFTYLSRGGEISNYKSKLIQKGDLSYVSVNNSINVWRTSTSELLKTYYNRKQKVSFFAIEEDLLIIGYKNGLIEVVNEAEGDNVKYRPHKKQINYLKKIDSLVLSVCAEGSIVLYDLVLETIKTRYKGNTYCIDSCACNGSIIVTGCSDSTLKIWDLDSEDIKDTIVFDRRMRDIFIIEKYILVFFMDGDTLIIDLESKETQQWIKFKKIRSIKLTNSTLSILTNKKLSQFETKVTSKLILVEIDNQKTENRYVDVDFYNESNIYIAMDNEFEIKSQANTHNISYHAQNIISVCSDPNNNICSFSLDKLVVWDVNGDALERIGCIEVVEGEAFACFKDYYVIGTKNALNFYNINTRDLVLSKEMNVRALDAGSNCLVVGSENTVIFFDEKLEIYEEFDAEDLVSYVKLSEDLNLLFVSKLNSKVHAYELPTLDQKLVLYGHSLPVKHIAISPDGKNIITTGADKVIKIWGIQFGECRKTIVNDTQNTEYINSDLFMVGTNTIRYYNKFDIIKEFKYKSNYVKLLGEYLFSIFENSISLFKMDKYELNVEDSSEDSDEELQKETQIVNTKKYDEFLSLVEDLEDGKFKTTTNCTIERFYNFIDRISFSEIDSYLILLSASNVDTILKTLRHYLDNNPILISRILITLVTQHKDITTQNSNFKFIVENLKIKIKEIREMIGMNLAAFSLANNDNFYGEDEL
ncbi:U3 small nucleolar RNA-associated protein 12 [Nosema granulosis]|uniref:U3 small nucleolar RNA-associated protein 12 n=1 Tax=Nosema granulosis TaxID=83296 RepID=A0A9P6GWC7_9MICR|nr:U3 small nucleolar RNA-associated protein 12 [Nosema granulosis]